MKTQRHTDEATGQGAAPVPMTDVRPGTKRAASSAALRAIADMTMQYVRVEAMEPGNIEQALWQAATAAYMYDAILEAKAASGWTTT